VRGIGDEQVALYVAKLEKEIGTTINEAAFAQVTGASTE
jgi:peptidyl-prolyl cis-trans isomerase D